MHAGGVGGLGAFALDYLVRLVLTDRRRELVRTHWLDLCAVLLPLIQPIRLLRLVSTLCSSDSGPEWRRRYG